MRLVPRGRGLRDPNLRDRLYELLEHDPLAYSAGSRFIQIIIGVIVLNVTAMVLASVPDLDAQFGTLFSAITILSVIVFALEYAARLWTVAGHTPRKGSALADRLGYAFSALGIIDLMAFLPAAIVLTTGRHATLAALGVLPFFKLIRYSPAMRSLLAAVHAERRALIGCVVILIGVVLTFASLLYAIERDVQPDKLGTIPQAMWWAIVTLGTVGYGDVVPVTALGKFVSVFAIISGFAMIALPVAIISTAFAEEVKRRDFVVTWGMLARVPLFSHLAAAEIADIMRLLRARTVEQGEILVRRGDPASSMYFITAGEVEIALPSQHVLLTDGTFFGEIALLHKTKRSGTVTATRKTRLLVLDAQDFHALIARMPMLAAHVHQTAKARLEETGDLAAAELAQAERDGGDR
ncbi:cyclic nucleotide-gated ion channel/potassium channel family protein [Bradyrhizobium sp. WYCCWR 13023]|uniref:Cyclic nucleotide-gated ion channel/potassium channel family protein n=1 Tax=Bradyrhizobium zhengyangense TaxID=2911009 RepID=A0A9X1RCT1_9BRAD|nr:MULTISPECIES: cyclic nucleotide-gated ion channel [Bradyrhizobium]MCG2629576.1 cyclic nucleotide-gated ion channel/potassium channel family protein [Bradyrhizobium zhengyangense]MCG2643908.1 cyclic nucleotide-gated ion channel/potassium channel family protein [Bradyrhizobium zhengyangense]MCG2671096.1 cyclic nucleotide-gated ion channel/potassium channel family protein [Bradyrhizobium zhengyangense]MDA9519497.1 cyclic nucleotide-binding protein [Bradyrhizobium sp. CCBAU 11434]